MPLRNRNDQKFEPGIKKNIDKATKVAEKVSLVRVDVFENLVKNKSIIPTGGSTSPNTHEKEKLFGMQSSVYFYLGRACPKYGDYAIALRVNATNKLPQAWTPFDTGAMFKYFKAQDNLERAKEYYQEVLSQISNPWKDFAWFLAAYFNEPRDYWEKAPIHLDSERRYDWQPPEDINLVRWTLWTWEIRIEQEVDIKGSSNSSRG